MQDYSVIDFRDSAENIMLGRTSLFVSARTDIMGDKDRREIHCVPILSVAKLLPRYNLVNLQSMFALQLQSVIIVRQGRQTLMVSLAPIQNTPCFKEHDDQPLTL